MAGQMGDVMLMSSAAGLPLSHSAMRMSAGLVGTTTKIKDLIPQAIVAYYDISSMPAGHNMMTKRIKGCIGAEWTLN
eukprot:Em0009g786a